MISTAETAVLDWVYDRIGGPRIDSYNIASAIAKALEEAPTPEHAWTAFMIGLSSCDHMPDHIEADILAMLTSLPESGVQFLSGSDKAFYDQLPDMIDVYRGGQGSRRLGMSWTTDPAVARMFADGHRGAITCGSVAQATIAKSDILSVSQERQESTVVINPSIVGRLADLKRFNEPAARAI
jgi:hypothetical protein